MTKHALVINGIIDTISLEPAEGWLPVPDDAFAGYSWDGEAATPPVPVPPTLEEFRAARLANLAAKRWTVETGGIVVNGAPIRTDRETAAILTAAYVTAMTDPGYSVNWKAGPGLFVVLDAMTIIAISAAVRGHIQACFDREAELSARIMAAEDGEAVASIDIEEGWPG